MHPRQMAGAVTVSSGTPTKLVEFESLFGRSNHCCFALTRGFERLYAATSEKRAQMRQPRATSGVTTGGRTTFSLQWTGRGTLRPCATFWCAASTYPVEQKPTRTCSKKTHTQRPGTLKTFTSLHNQKPVRLPRVVLFSTKCTPPVVFSSRDPPNVLAMIRRKNSVLLSITLLIFLSHPVLPTRRPLLSCRRPILRLSSFPEDFFCTIFQGSQAFLHHWFIAIRIVTAFHLFQAFFGWYCLLPLTLYSCLLFFVSQLPKLLRLRSFTRENAPTSRADMVLSPLSSTFFHDTLSFQLPVSTAHLTAALLLLPAGAC